MSEIVWGPEIAVDGKRPEWLGDDDRPVCACHGNELRPGSSLWFTLEAIRLPADHPHYAAQQPRTAPSGGEVGPEVDKARLKALEAFWEFVVDTQPYDDALDAILAKARALLPEPVDADVEEANRVEAEVAGSQVFDCSIDLQRAIALAAIKRGRALAAGDR